MVLVKTELRHTKDKEKLCNKKKVRNFVRMTEWRRTELTWDVSYETENEGQIS
jgi:hypothetical protein